MGKGILISATGTDVGKTFVAAGIGHRLMKQGKRVAYYKPIQSGGELHEGKLVAPDVRFVQEVCGGVGSMGCYNTYCFTEPVSPHLAAEMDKIDIDTDKIIMKYWELMKDYDYVIVEGAGGLAVPLIRDELWIYDLAKLLQLDVILVADAGVGTLSHTITSHAFAHTKNIGVPLIILNHYDELDIANVDNKRIIGKAIQGAEVLTLGSCNGQESDSIRKNYARWFGGVDMASLLLES